MKLAKLEDMKLGWFIGNFSPSLLYTDQFEVAIKEYAAGDSEEWHYHKVATEFTVIVRGVVLMNGKEYGKGDIIVMDPGEGTDFCALEPTVTAVVKTPCVPNDKFQKGE